MSVNNTPRAKSNSPKKVSLAPALQQPGSPKSTAHSFSPTKTWTSGSGFLSSCESPKFHNLSSSVLQHSASSYRFPQAERFPDPKTTGPNKYFSSRSSLGNKTTNMGFGGRFDVTHFSNNQDTLQYPSPQKYKRKSEFEEESPKGKTFGLSYSAYDKVYIPGNQYIPIPFTKKFPGPGAYYSDRDISGEMSKFTFKSRGKMFNEGLGLDAPKCNQYTPKATLVSPSRFNKTTFGFGDKYDFTKPPNANPGPGSYNPPSFIDKIHKRSSSYRGPQLKHTMDSVK